MKFDSDANERIFSANISEKDRTPGLSAATENNV
jgi:hypothetical protein